MAILSLFVDDMLETMEFTIALSSYKVSQINEKKIIPLNELVNRWPLGGYCSDGDMYIVNRYNMYGHGFSECQLNKPSDSLDSYWNLVFVAEVYKIQS
jgi:hypothetical protein